jgi:hypothetical protein
MENEIIFHMAMIDRLMAGIETAARRISFLHSPGEHVSPEERAARIDDLRRAEMLLSAYRDSLCDGSPSCARLFG